MKKILMTLTLALAAAISIPATAQTATTTEPVKEYCKDKKDCAKDEGKACCKAEDKKACAKEEGKACCKAEGKKACAKAEGQPCYKDGKPAGIQLKNLKKKGSRRFAGDSKEMGKMRRNVENPMFNGITLTEDQQQKLKALREKNKAEKKKSKAELKEKDRTEMMRIRAEFDKEVEKILDKDQLKQYQANKAELEAKRAVKQAKMPKLEKKAR